MFLRAWHNENDPPDERVLVEPLIKSVGLLLEAVGKGLTELDEKGLQELEKIEAIIGRMSGDGFEQACLDELIAKLNDLTSEVVEQNGRLDVRYVGDLKPSKYSLSDHFYHLTQTSTDADLKEIVRDAITRGLKEVFLINLANVRDIKISIGNTKVANLEVELALVKTALKTFQEWDYSGFWARLEE